MARTRTKKLAGVWEKNGVWMLRIPSRVSNATKKSTGTKDVRLANEMRRMVETLAHRREWELLEAVTGADRRVVNPVTRKALPTRGAIALGELYDAFAANALEALRARLKDADLGDYVEVGYSG